MATEMLVLRLSTLSKEFLSNSRTTRSVFAVTVAARGALWIGTDHGVARYAAGRFQNLTTDEGLPSNSATALCDDGQGGIWIGTSSGLRVWNEGTLGRVAGAEHGSMPCGAGPTRSAHRRRHPLHRRARTGPRAARSAWQRPL